jgi:hypothetical protein
MTRTSLFVRDLREPATVSPALAKSIAETQADIRAAFRRRLAKDCMSQVNEQPRIGYDLTPTCPTCGCLDVIIQGHEMSCKRCWTTTDRSKEPGRATK